MHKKISIPIYNPNNELEALVQEQYHASSSTAGWLSMQECRLFTDAIYSLKRYSQEWFENKAILKNRISYFFAKEMNPDSSEIIFMTFPIFLRDILERNLLDDYLSAPVVFVTKPIAYYLFPEYTVQIVLDKFKLEALNSDVFDKIGNLWISNKNVKINKETIVQIKSSKNTFNIVKKITTLQDFKKTAVTEISRNIFKIDPDEKYLSTGSSVLYKLHNIPGIIKQVEPGESGHIHIKLENGKMIAVDKINFDKHFVVTNIKIASLSISNVIKNKIKSSKLVNYLFKLYGTNVNEVDNLAIKIVPLHDKYAETGKVMKINSSLFDNGLDYFLDNYFFIIVHELIHFLFKEKHMTTSVQKGQHYFEDSEERKGFIVAIAYELSTGKSEEDVWENIYPKVEWHFHEKEDSETFFEHLIDQANKIIEGMNNHKET